MESKNIDQICSRAERLVSEVRELSKALEQMKKDLNENSDDEMRHYIGSTYATSVTGEAYMLATVDAEKACLICLEDGNRWFDAVRINENLDEFYNVYINQQDFEAVCNNKDFTLLHLPHSVRKIKEENRN